MDYLQYHTKDYYKFWYQSFKPYYKWITFNIFLVVIVQKHIPLVLNLIINGLPSISEAEKENPQLLLEF